MDPTSTHHVYRTSLESLPCYCQADADHRIGEEVKRQDPPMSRVEQMIAHVNFKWALNRVRRRVSNNNVTGLMAMAVFMEENFPNAPLTFGQKLLRPFRQLKHRFMNKFFPEPIDNSCPCCP